MPPASTRPSLWHRVVRIFTRAPIAIARCPRCGRQLDNEGQRARLPRRLREPVGCNGAFNFAMPGEPPVMLCLGFRTVSR